MTPEQLEESRAAAESARRHCPGLPRRLGNYLVQALDEIDYLRAQVERLQRVEEVVKRILAKWEAQAANAREWQKLAARARAADPNDKEEQRAIRRERQALDVTRVHDFGDLRMDLGEVLGEQ